MAADLEYRKLALRQKQSLPLEGKIILAQQRIREWYEHWDGQVYISFSGGKDSTVLMHLVKELYPHVPTVFVDTGLEYPEVRKFATERADVVLRPKLRFDQVIQKYGYPVIGKKQARYIRDLQSASEGNRTTVNLRLTGYNSKGQYCPAQKLAAKWIPLGDAPFRISEQCCDVTKKEPFKRYEKETGRHPFTGEMACESSLREKEYLSTGCNVFDAKTPKSRPLSTWLEQDILQYIATRKLEIPSVYGDVVQEGDSYALTGCKRTGCMFCMFGVQFDQSPNRFQRMQETHPRQYAYCMKPVDDGGLGLKEVLEYIGVPYE